MKNHKRISAKEFIRIWQTSKTLDDVCDHFGLSKSSASTRATNFRTKGVMLKSFNSSRKGTDWKAMADYANSLVENDD